MFSNIAQTVNNLHIRYYVFVEIYMKVRRYVIKEVNSLA